MFNLFKKDNYQEQGVELAKLSKIDIVLEDGSISYFLIFIQERASLARKKLKNSELRSSFVNTIETRITNQEYEDPRRMFTNDLTYDISNHDDNVSNVPRGVLSKDKDILLRWGP